MKAKETVKKKFKLGPIQRAWVRALRSGKYKQTTGVLTMLKEDKPAGYCCLGVLCDLAVKRKITSVDFSGEYAKYTDDLEESVVPEKIREWAALRCELGSLESDSDESLAHMNDNGTSFKEIAAIIEKEASFLFRESR